jgi:hypothetical protein
MAEPDGQSAGGGGLWPRAFAATAAIALVVGFTGCGNSTKH